MGIFFGTDGIRGVACEELTYDLAYKCGNAVAVSKDKANIIIGRDTRLSGSYLTTAFALGAMSAGANVVDVGVCTTPGIAYITKTLKADFGVVVSASHNPAKYNGIKIFSGDGYKLGDDRENALERKFINSKVVNFDKVGTFDIQTKHTELYAKYLKYIIKTSFDDLKVVLDGSCGASYELAPKVFRDLGASVIETSCKNDGANINSGCGSLYPENISKLVKQTGADMGFAFDGDADRIIACDENGNILDGDILLFIMAKYLKEKGKLKKDTLVGTRHTNMGLENTLKDMGIKLVRTDIGDKYVLERMLADKLNLGGEKSGHIIFGDYATTGDGVLSALIIAQIVKESGKKLSELSQVNLFPQANIDVVVSDKIRVINSEKVSDMVETIEAKLGDKGRVMVRVSGTEPKIRIMVETDDEKIAKDYAKEIEDVVKEVSGAM